MLQVAFFAVLQIQLSAQEKMQVMLSFNQKDIQMTFRETPSLELLSLSGKIAHCLSAGTETDVYVPEIKWPRPIDHPLTFFVKEESDKKFLPLKHLSIFPNETVLVVSHQPLTAEEKKKLRFILGTLESYGVNIEKLVYVVAK